MHARKLQEVFKRSLASAWGKDNLSRRRFSRGARGNYAVNRGAARVVILGAFAVSCQMLYLLTAALRGKGAR